MTKVKTVLTEYKPGYCRYEFTVEGHATGSVEACAGISALMQALHCYLLNVKDHVEVHEIQTNGNGFYRIDFEGGEPAFTAYMVILSGILSIEAGYPEYVKVDRTIIEYTE